MQYQVKMTMYATEQVKETVSYISHELASPDTARGWSAHLEKEIVGLNTFPDRFPCVEEEPWKSRGFRKMFVKNFTVYFFVNNEEQTVWVTAVIYSRRDQLEQLKKMPL